MMSIQEGSYFKAHYHLHLRCHNCHKISGRLLAVPDVDDAPNDIDELLESELLNRIPFSCDKCQNPIATIVGVKPAEMHS
jgi:hypothetical protein